MKFIVLNLQKHASSLFFFFLANLTKYFVFKNTYQNLNKTEEKIIRVLRTLLSAHDYLSISGNGGV